MVETSNIDQIAVYSTVYQNLLVYIFITDNTCCLITLFFIWLAKSATDTNTSTTPSKPTLHLLVYPFYWNNASILVLQLHLIVKVLSIINPWVILRGRGKYVSTIWILWCRQRKYKRVHTNTYICGEFLKNVFQLTLNIILHCTMLSKQLYFIPLFIIWWWTLGQSLTMILFGKTINDE